MIERILMGLGIACFLYYLMIVVYAGITADFAWIWAFGGVVLLALGYWAKRIRHGEAHLPLWLFRTSIGVLLVGVLALTLLTGVVVKGMKGHAPKGLDYVVVLGAQVRGTTPSRSLAKRLVCAKEYAEQNPETRLILTGGQGSGEDITEAECMYTWLTNRGIDPERLILEDKSVSTHENLKFANDLTGCAESNTGIISNDFHISRAVLLARKQGYLTVSGIPAGSDPILEVHYILREDFALVKERLTGQI